MTKKPLITIVTPSYNQGRFLEETILSVLNQGYPNLEYIIIDGGSTDQSLEIIKKYEKRLTYWQSEKDKGQTDAIRQGFLHATGEILNWLNSDDLLAPGALHHIAELADANPHAGIFAAATESFRDGYFSDKRKKSIPQNLDVESFLYLSGRPPYRHQPGIFFRRDLYEAVGEVQPRYYICMDFDLHLRMLEHGARVAYSDRAVAYFRSHSTSKTQQGSARNTLTAVREYMQVCDQVGKRLDLIPNHKRAHLKTLCGAALRAILKGQFNDALTCLALALRISGPFNLSCQVASIILRRPVRKGGNR